MIGEVKPLFPEDSIGLMIQQKLRYQVNKAIRDHIWSHREKENTKKLLEIEEPSRLEPILDTSESKSATLNDDSVQRGSVNN